MLVMGRKQSSRLGNTPQPMSLPGSDSRQFENYIGWFITPVFEPKRAGRARHQTVLQPTPPAPETRVFTALLFYLHSCAPRRRHTGAAMQRHARAQGVRL